MNNADRFRTIYHNQKFVIARVVIYMAVLIILAVMLHKRAPQKGASPEGMESPAPRIHAHETAPVAEALLANLEAVADKQLPSPALDGITELAVAVPQPENVAAQLTSLTQELGGTILPNALSLGDDFPQRIVFSIPPDKLPEFTRRAELLIGSPLPEKIGKDVFAITLRDTRK